MPAVSVVIPTYNRRKRVEQAVASVLAQTFHDFELLVIDDGSVDGTRQSLAGLDPRLHYVWQDNCGPAAARNAGIRLSAAPIVAFLDADNRWLPDHLEVIVAVLARFPEAVLASTCPRFEISGDARPDDAELIDPLRAAVLQNKFGYVSCSAARLQALRDLGGFDEQLLVGEDDDMWLRLAMAGPFAMLKRRTVIRRHTRGGLRDWGRMSGGYTEANTRSLERALAELKRRPSGPDTEELIVRARGQLQVLAAVRALERRDLPGARAGLAEACVLLPELASNPEPIMTQLWKSAGDPTELRRRVEGAAAAMPDPRCHSALYLRASAAGLAVTRGRLDKAARLVLRQPHLMRRDFIARAHRPLLKVATNHILEAVRSSRESPLARS
jgi:hypothetical protein